MSKREIAIFIILFIILALGKIAFAMNIGASQSGGTNIGVGQYETTASASTGNFFLLF